MHYSKLSLHLQSNCNCQDQKEQSVLYQISKKVMLRGTYTTMNPALNKSLSQTNRYTKQTSVWYAQLSKRHQLSYIKIHIKCNYSIYLLAVSIDLHR
jgi:hypothetical protein